MEQEVWPLDHQNGGGHPGFYRRVLCRATAGLLTVSDLAADANSCSAMTQCSRA
jgi:hypothetical protein